MSDIRMIGEARAFVAKKWGDTRPQEAELILALAQSLEDYMVLGEAVQIAVLEKIKDLEQALA